MSSDRTIQANEASPGDTQHESLADGTILVPGEPAASDSAAAAARTQHLDGAEAAASTDAAAATSDRTIIEPATGEGSGGGGGGEASTDATLVGETGEAAGDADRTIVEGGDDSASDPERTFVGGSVEAAEAGDPEGTLIEGGATSSRAGTMLEGGEDSFEAALARAQPKIAVGDSLIGRFRIQRVLGEGAFGTVYLAEDPQLDRKVAVKVSKVGVLASRSDVDRFMREARSAAQLRHPHIVPVYEVGRFGQCSFIAYAFVEGTTLGGFLKERRKLPPREAAELMRLIALALDYAHSHGIVHRDMKPDNVLLDKKGEPHIADFGLARREDQSTDRTREGGLMGTPLYMSPEQASGKGRDADARSDVWSLGVMLREMLTGVLPFEGDLTQVLIAVRTLEPPSIRTLDASLPRDLETICQKCLTKDLAQRYQTAGELADELDRWLRGEPIKARPIGVLGRTYRWMRRNPAVASLLGTVCGVLLLGAIVSTYFAISAEREARRARAEQTNRALAQMNSLKAAEPGAVPVLLETLRPYRGDILEQLRDDLKGGELTELERTRLQVAEMSLFPESVEGRRRIPEVTRSLLGVSPREAAVLTNLLSPFRDEVSARLLAAVESSETGQGERFVALSALASLRPDDPLWDRAAADLGAGLLSANPVDLPSWLSMTRPLRDRLLPAIETEFRSGEPQARLAAARVLALMFADQPTVLYALARDAGREQLRPLVEALRERSAVAAELAVRDVARAEGSTAFAGEEVRRRANLFVLLYALGARETPWSWLAASEDNTLRTELMHAVPLSGASWKGAADRVPIEPDSSIRQALLQMLAGYPVTELLPADRQALKKTALKLVRSDPSSEVHAAAEWLLTTWGAAEELAAERKALAEASPVRDQRWRVDALGNEFALFAGPVEYLMGAAADDPERATVEREHWRRLPRSFAIGMREVTVAEFARFAPDHAYNPEASPEPTCPINEISWFDAAKYCRWLSEQAGVPEEQMCFPPLDQILPGMILPEGVLDRTGYRLPTAAEWEYACRGGSRTSRPFGRSHEWAESYVWFDRNAENHAWPVGRLKPGEFGLFDMNGNVMEWCFDWYFDDYPPATPASPVIDGTDTREGVYREVRGNGFNSSIDLTRTPDRDYDLPFNTSFVIGMRLARTLPRGM